MSRRDACSTDHGTRPRPEKDGRPTAQPLRCRRACVVPSTAWRCKHDPSRDRSGARRALRVRREHPRRRGRRRGEGATTRLKGCKNLRELYLEDAPVTDEGQKELEAALPKI